MNQTAANATAESAATRANVHNNEGSAAACDGAASAARKLNVSFPICTFPDQDPAAFLARRAGRRRGLRPDLSRNVAKVYQCVAEYR